jgi:hypothetical protein
MLYKILVLMLAIPVGILIAKIANDELSIGKKYFRILIIASLIGVIGFWLYGRNVESMAFGFIGIISLVSLVKSN